MPEEKGDTEISPGIKVGFVPNAGISRASKY